MHVQNVSCHGQDGDSDRESERGSSAQTKKKKCQLAIACMFVLFERAHAYVRACIRPGLDVEFHMRRMRREV